ncbi:hypothetical protein SK128_002847 [Halocaridina rubra]|uniref:Uncharacterized protein n=1 Tax=Halocaridina rubra TaxID=373956 RepID=A0AAN9A4Z2_HALRR
MKKYQSQSPKRNHNQVIGRNVCLVEEALAELETGSNTSRHLALKSRFYDLLQCDLVGNISKYEKMVVSRLTMCGQ